MGYLIALVAAVLFVDLFQWFQICRKLAKWQVLFDDLPEFRCWQCADSADCFAYQERIPPSFPCDYFYTKKH